MAYKFQRGSAILSGALTQEGDVKIESGSDLIMGSATLTETDMAKIDGITNGTVAASKAIVVDANKDFSGLRNATATGAITAGTSFIIGFTVDADGDTALKSLAVDDGSTIGPDSVSDLITLAADGDITIKDGAYDFDIASHDATNGLKLGGVLVTSTAAELNLVDGITAGTVAASKAVIVDSNKDITGFRNVTATGYFEIGSAQLTESELEMLDGITAGTVAASKAIVVDSNKDFTGLRNATATGAITAGTSFIIGSADLNEADMEKLDGITNGTAAASKAVVLDANKDVSGVRDISGRNVTLSTLSQGRLVTAGASGLLEDQGELVYDDGRSHGYLELRVSSSASGSAVVGDGYFNLSDAAENPMFQVSKYQASDAEEGLFFSDVAAPGATAVATDVILFQDGDDDSRYKKEALGDVRDLFFGAVSGDATVAAGGALTIAADAVEGSMLNDNVISGQTELAHNGLAAADEMMISDAGVLKKIGVDILFADGPGLLTAADVAVGSDHFMFLDGGATGDAKTESISDLVTAMAGVGLGAASGVLKLSLDELSDAAVASGDKFAFVDATDDSSKLESIDDMASFFAGVGLAASSGVLALDLNELVAETIASGDFLAFVDSTDNGTHKESVDDLAALFAGAGLAASSAVIAVANATNGGIGVQANDIKLDMNDLAAGAVSVANDSIAIIDADDSNKTKKESIVDLVSAMAGAGLAASSGVLAVQGNSVALKASGDTLAEGYNYFADIGASDSSAAVDLPAAPSVGDVVTVKAGNLASGKVIRVSVDSGTSHTIDGNAAVDLESPFAAVTLVYVVADNWRIV